MDPEVRDISSLFDTMSIKVTKEWLEGCVSYFREENPGSSFAELKSFVHHQWTLSDLRESTHGCLPSDLSSHIKITLKEEYTLQVESFLNVQESAYSQLQRIRKEDISNVAATEKPTENWLPRGRRVLKMVLCDGHQKINAVEFKPLPMIKECMLPGVKITIKGPVICRRGVLLLKPENLKILGGEVDTLLVSNHVENILARALNFPENPNPLGFPITNGAENELNRSDNSPVSRESVEDIARNCLEMPSHTDIRSNTSHEEPDVPLGILEDLNAADWTDADLTEYIPSSRVQSVSHSVNQVVLSVPRSGCENVLGKGRPHPPAKKVKTGARTTEYMESSSSESRFELGQCTSSPKHVLGKNVKNKMNSDISASSGEVRTLNCISEELHPETSASDVKMGSRNTVKQSSKLQKEKNLTLQDKSTCLQSAGKQRADNTALFDKWMIKKEENPLSSVEDVDRVSLRKERKVHDKNSSEEREFLSKEDSQCRNGDDKTSIRNRVKDSVKLANETNLLSREPQWVINPQAGGFGNCKQVTVAKTSEKIRGNLDICETVLSGGSDSSSPFTLPPNMEKKLDNYIFADYNQEIERSNQNAKKSGLVCQSTGQLSLSGPSLGYSACDVEACPEQTLDRHKASSSGSCSSACNLSGTETAESRVPLVYLCGLPEFCEQSHVLFRVKATIVRLVSRLTVNDQEDWALSAEITDGTGSIKVHLSPQVLNTVIGFRGADLMKIKKGSGNNRAKKGKALEALQRSQQKLVDLCCLFDIKLNKEDDFPIVVALHQITPSHIEILELESNEDSD